MPDDARMSRLGEALRRNLQRRKAQARERQVLQEPTPTREGRDRPDARWHDRGDGSADAADSPGDDVGGGDYRQPIHAAPRDPAAHAAHAAARAGAGSAALRGRGPSP